MTHPDDQRLRDAMLGSSRVAGDGEGCPEAERLRLSARGKLSGAEQEEVILHLSACGACAAAWRVARDLAPEPARSRSVLYMLAAAAVVVLAAALGLWLLQHREPTAPPTFRNQESRWLHSEVTGPSLPRDAFALRWTAGPEGTTYDLRVLRENLDVLHRANGLETASHTVPQEALEDLPAGAKVLWQVTARLPDGRTTVSETFITRVE
jgi:hypothetical protein